MNSGILSGIGAYTLWGILPVYWKLLKDVPASQLISHRIIWSFVFLFLFILLSGGWREFLRALTLKVILIYSAAAVIIYVNWFTYVWGVNAGFILETSLGYFINPLINMLFGILFFRERLRPAQWVPVFLAFLGVAYLTVVYGRLPYIALTLAFSFAFYGVVKKISPLGSLQGLTVETAILFIPAVAYLLFRESGGTGAFIHAGIMPTALMIGAGIVTSIPLLMFASTAKSVPLWIIGLMQYIAPTLQFLIGLFIYDEPFSRDRLIGFSLVWFAVIIFLAENRYSKLLRPEETP